MDRLHVILLSTGFVLFMLLVATDRNGMMVVEVRRCEQSHRFRGKCQSKSSCAAVCQTGGFSECKGLRCRCSYTEHCSSSIFILAYDNR